MSEPLEREWCFYVTDMIGFAEKVVLYTDGLDQEKFVASGLNYDATVHNLILLGEAATHIPDRVRTFASEIDWRQIIGTRNRLVHGYVGIDNDIVWNIIQDEIPALINQLHALEKALEANQIR
jgi:uncharacterized protein with HEPN domain